MTKKKNKDFQKVRIKVGRKLKRRNETVIDLTKRKILLPKERTKTEESTATKSVAQILDESIASLNIENVSVQLNSLQTMNRHLESLAKRLANLIGNDHYSVLTIPHRSMGQILDLYQMLFSLQSASVVGSGAVDSCWGLQLGNLIHTLSRLCRSGQDPRLCNELWKIFNAVINLVCCHPKCPYVLSSLELAAVNLLQRNEPKWCWLGVRLTNLIMTTHRQLNSTWSLHPPRASQLGWCSADDSTQCLVRYRIYSRLLLRSFRNLKHWCSLKDLPEERASLIQATMNVLKYYQYSARNHSDHPWCRPIPWSGDHLSSAQPYLPLNGYYLGAISSHCSLNNTSDLQPSILAMEKMHLLQNVPSSTTVNWYPDQSRTKRSRGISSNRDSTSTPATLSLEPLWHQQMMDDRSLALNLLEEGLVILNGLFVDQTELAYRSLYHTIRGLRVLAETKNPAFFLSDSSSKSDSKSGWTGLSDEKNLDLSGPLCRFLTKLYELFPFSSTKSQDKTTSLQETASKPSSKQSQSTLNQLVNTMKVAVQRDDVPLTRKELQQQRKRANKLMRRQQRNSKADDSNAMGNATSSNSGGGGGGGDEDGVPCTETSKDGGIDDGKQIKSDNKQTDPEFSKLILWGHRLDQSILELFAFIEVIHETQSEDAHTSSSKKKKRSLSAGIWPPPVKLQQRFAQFLVEELVKLSDGTLIYLSSLLGWFRAMDIYLLATARSKKFSSLTGTSNRHLFSAPILASLNAIFTRSVTHRILPNPSRLLNRGEYRLVGRSAGLLTAYLTYELIASRVPNCSNHGTDPLGTGDFGDEVPDSMMSDYDESWIGQQLQQLQLRLQPDQPRIFPTLVNHLRLLVTSQPPRIWHAPPLSTELLHQMANHLPVPMNSHSMKPVAVQLVDSTWTTCFLRLAQLQYSPALELLRSDHELSRRLTQTEQYFDRLVPLFKLRDQFNVTLTEHSSIEESMGWLVQGYLPSLDGCYSHFVFWRAPRDKSFA